MLLHLPPAVFDDGWVEAGRTIARTGRVIVDVLEALRGRQDAYSAYMAECIQRCTKRVRVATDSKQRREGAAARSVARAWRRTAPARKGWVKPDDATATEDSYALAAHLFHRQIRWHSGSTGGSLYGPIGDSLSYGEHYDRADTAAQVLMIATGQSMAAVAAWTRAIYGT